MVGEADAPRIGVLALQGDFEAHCGVLERLGAAPCEARTPRHLAGLDGLVIPGGESTTLLRLLDRDPRWWSALPRFAESGAVFGTCAGLILLAAEVEGPRQRSLGLLDVTVARNAWGRQIASFEGFGRWEDGRALEMVFIRAPRILRVGPAVQVLATVEGEPVLVRSHRILAASFHPELTADPSVHRLFLEMTGAEGAAGQPLAASTSPSKILR
jgi:5'-phosphate synthase pdxT subunit